jgi:hypothetical protein
MTSKMYATRFWPSHFHVRFTILPREMFTVASPLSRVAGHVVYAAAGHAGQRTEGLTTEEREEVRRLRREVRQLREEREIPKKPRPGLRGRPPRALAKISLATNPLGGIPLGFIWPAGVPAGTNIYFQYAIQDASADYGVALSNALVGKTP